MTVNAILVYLGDTEDSVLDHHNKENIATKQASHTNFLVSHCV